MYVSKRDETPGSIYQVVARGVDRRWVRELYSFAVKPDLAVYFRVPIDVSVDRLMARRVKLKFYEAGMDMGWSSQPLESFRIFQGKVLDEYDCTRKKAGDAWDKVFNTDYFSVQVAKDDTAAKSLLRPAATVAAGLTFPSHPVLPNKSSGFA